MGNKDLNRLKQQAINFYSASGVIYREILQMVSSQYKSDYDLINPYIVNSAFTIELLLKYLLMRDTNINNKKYKTHNLFDLYTLLEEKSDKDYNFIELVKKKPYCNEVTREYFILHLKDISENFINYRYSYEQKTTTHSVYIAFINAFLVTLFNELKDKNK